MEKAEIESFVDELMMDATASLSKALRYYYPARVARDEANGTEKWNALTEANLVMHVGIAASQQGGHSFPEVPDHSTSSSRIDLMTFFPSRKLKVLLEAKRLYNNKEKAEAILRDTDRLKRFQTNGEETEGLRAASASIGMVAAITHYREDAESWCNPRQIGTVSSSKVMVSLAEYLNREHVYKNRISVETWYTANGDEQPCWLLYAWSYL